MVLCYTTKTLRWDGVNDGWMRYELLILCVCLATCEPGLDAKKEIYDEKVYIVILIPGEFVKTLDY